MGQMSNPSKTLRFIRAETLSYWKHAYSSIIFLLFFYYYFLFFSSWRRPLPINYRPSFLSVSPFAPSFLIGTRINLPLLELDSSGIYQPLAVWTFCLFYFNRLPFGSLLLVKPYSFFFLFVFFEIISWKSGKYVFDYFLFYIQQFLMNFLREIFSLVDRT